MSSLEFKSPRDGLAIVDGIPRIGCWIIKHMCRNLAGKSGDKAWELMDTMKMEVCQDNRRYNRIYKRFRRIPLIDIQSRPVEMVIDPILPRGEVTIIDGNPDAGKSWLWMALLAGLTGSKNCSCLRH